MPWDGLDFLEFDGWKEGLGNGVRRGGFWWVDDLCRWRGAKLVMLDEVSSFGRGG